MKKHYAYQVSRDAYEYSALHMKPENFKKLWRSDEADGNNPLTEYYEKWQRINEEAYEKRDKSYSAYFKKISC